MSPPSAKLDALLPWNQSSAGRFFPSLLDERDRPRFLEFVNPTSANRKMLHVSVRDDDGALVSVQIFHCSIRDLHGNYVAERFFSRSNIDSGSQEQ